MDYRASLRDKLASLKETGESLQDEMTKYEIEISELKNEYHNWVGNVALTQGMDHISAAWRSISYTLQLIKEINAH